MKITLRTYGGFAAAIPRPAQELDSSKLPPPSAAELDNLVNAAVSSTPRADETAGRARDAISYELTIDRGDAVVTLNASDASMSPAFGNLLDWVEQRVDDAANNTGDSKK